LKIDTFKKALDRINYEHFVFLKATELLKMGSANFDVMIKIEKDGKYETPDMEFVDGVGIVIR
jgi:hypothetical protein